MTTETPEPQPRMTIGPHGVVKTCEVIPGVGIVIGWEALEYRPRRWPIQPEAKTGGHGPNGELSVFESSPSVPFFPKPLFAPDLALHDLDSPHCWCGPDLVILCPECCDEARGVTCWRCESTGWLPAQADEEHRTIFHQNTTSLIRRPR